MQIALRSAALALALGIAAIAPSRAGADLITYTESALVTGTLGSTSFTNALLTLTATADTTQVVDVGGGFFSVTPLSNSFTIAGVGGGTITQTGFRAYVNQAFSPPAVGFSIEGLGSILATFNQTFATYNLKTSLEPTTGGAFVNSGVVSATSAGNLNLTSFSSDATFQATLVPEPASIAMVGIGLAGIGFIARRARGHQAA